jgi:hypothetical protein
VISLFVSIFLGWVVLKMLLPRLREPIHIEQSPAARARGSLPLLACGSLSAAVKQSVSEGVRSQYGRPSRRASERRHGFHGVAARQVHALSLANQLKRLRCSFVGKTGQRDRAAVTRHGCPLGGAWVLVASSVPGERVFLCWLTASVARSWGA